MSDTDSNGPLNVTRLSTALGAEVRGLDLALADDTDAQTIRDLLNEHQVLFFPDQQLSQAEHVRLGGFFGRLEGHPNLKNPYPDFPEIFELAASKGGIADEWHTDLTFQEEPALMSILHMVTCPDVGGDTMWSSLTAAFDALSAPMQDLCCGLTALHDAHPHNRPEKMAVHPVVRVHPDTGRRALYVNEHFTRRIVEMNAYESEHLLRYLTRWVQNPSFTVRYRWQPGTIAMWDNRATQHFVVNDFEGERVIQRVTVVGDRPEGVDAPRWEPEVQAYSTAAGRLDRQLRRYLRDQASA